MFLLEQVVNGLVLGGYYLLIALGLSLIFSVGGVVNLAHGAFYALGAYASVEITKYLGFGPAVVLSPVAVALLGILFERFILRRFYTADPILSLLVTFASRWSRSKRSASCGARRPCPPRSRRSFAARWSSATSCSRAIAC
jgi:branched-subunit amino acid ABC-type transport system permease component